MFSFAQQSDTVKVNQLSPSLNLELRKSTQNIDSLKYNLNINKYQEEAIKLRKKESLEQENKLYRNEGLRNDLLRYGQSKGKSNLNL